MGNTKQNWHKDSGWDGDKDVASVYLTKYLRIRLTDPDKNPIPKAKCRLANNRENIITCDEHGIAQILPPENGEKQLYLEWERADAAQIDSSNRFYWKNIFYLKVDDMNDVACSTRLTHLGFCSAAIEEQVSAYNAWAGKSYGAELSDIRDEMVRWHDGGSFPVQRSTPITPIADQTVVQGQETDEAEPIDRFAGTEVSEVMISLARGRIGFQTSLGMLSGAVETDLAVGTYELEPDIPNKRWIVRGDSVKAGLRFNVRLEGANPWTLSYPERLPLRVYPGAAPPETAGEMDEEFFQKDPLWVYDQTPPEMMIEPITGPDDFLSVHYDISYRSEGGDLSKWIIVYYRDNTKREFNIDDITEDTPRLMAMKREVLVIMDDYNAEFILSTVPILYFILTLSLGQQPPSSNRSRWVVSRRGVPRSRGGSSRTESDVEAPNSNAPNATKPGSPPARTPTVELPNGTRLPPDHHSGGYHGTDVPPEVALSKGLKARGNDWNMLRHSEDNPQSALRGVTDVVSDPVNKGGAAAWAGEGNYVYEIRNVPTWNVNNALQGRVRILGEYRGNRWSGEMENAIPGDVDPGNIVRAGIVKSTSSGKLYVQWIN